MSSSPTDNNEWRFFHAVATVLDGDYRKIEKLHTQHTSWSASWNSLSHSKLFGKISPDSAESSLSSQNISLIMREDESFPPLLREIPYAPFGIYVKGTLPRHEHYGIAVVGTRKATREGRAYAESLARDLSPTCVITSGLAFGIDVAAHTGCLSNKGHTIAVLAGGVENPHPRSNAGLAARIIAQGGALVSEYPPGSAPAPHRFLERNRIISGLTLGTVIVEAPEGSGALATARFALDQNREIFVVPGPVTHPNFRGSHHLLRAGARLIRNAEDIFEDLNITPPQSCASLIHDIHTPEENAVLRALHHASTPLSVDMVISETGLNAATVNRTMSFLLIKNMVQETGSGYILSP
ncbi:MAG: DNA-processing protein DprA [Patescibacteria group bacterium]|nr:DNA-processing protein DprA [Patescibacteria group bacterium]